MNFDSHEQSVQDRKWRSRNIDSIGVMAAAEIAVEIIWYLVFDVLLKTFDVGFIRYLLHYPLVSAVINFSALYLVKYINSRDDYDDRMKNRAVCIQLMVFCLEIQVVHCDFTVALSAPCAAIIVAMILMDTRLAATELGVTLCASVIATAKAWTEGVYNQPAAAAANLIISMIISVCVFILSGTLATHQREQLQTLKETQQRQSRLMEEMKIDPLTGLFNRKTFDESVGVRIAAANRNMLNPDPNYRFPIMAVLDIDLFKRINDTYGHIRGDDVLMSLSASMRSKTAGLAGAFRYGGEEFVIIFDKNDINEVVDILESIRSEFSDKKYPFAPGVRVSVSAGVAQLEKNMDAKSWFALADSALYKAKKTGRDKVVVLREM